MLRKVFVKVTPGTTRAVQNRFYVIRAFVKRRLGDPQKCQNRVCILNVHNQWNLFDALKVEIGLAEHVKPREAPLLRDVRAPARGSRPKILMRVKTCFE